MDNLDTKADEITDEVARLARTAAVAIERICRTARDPAAAQAARLSLGAVLLGQAVTSEAAVDTVNDIWRGRWRMAPVH
jgi:hypothetical protein